MDAQVMVVDDDAVLADMVVCLLAQAGISALASYSGTDAFSLLASSDAAAVKLVVLDIMMPDMDGFEVCRRIRRFSDVAVMFLSAKGEEVDKVCGFTLGADDYVEKPFLPREFVARVRARLRRSSDERGDAVGTRDELLRIGGLAVDSRSHVASLNDINLVLTPKEFSILELLLCRVGEPVSTREIYETCWGECFDSAAQNTVAVHIRRLRVKIAEIDSTEEPIKTVWGVGYKVDAPGMRSAATEGDVA